jgi:hypothetical protein
MSIVRINLHSSERQAIKCISVNHLDLFRKKEIVERTTPFKNFALDFSQMAIWFENNRRKRLTPTETERRKKLNLVRDNDPGQRTTACKQILNVVNQTLTWDLKLSQTATSGKATPLQGFNGTWKSYTL